MGSGAKTMWDLPLPAAQTGIVLPWVWYWTSATKALL